MDQAGSTICENTENPAYDQKKRNNVKDATHIFPTLLVYLKKCCQFPVALPEQ